MKGKIIFDNGGGTTLQLPGYAHLYSDSRQAARDLADYLNAANIDDWDGNEPESAELNPSLEEIEDGSYQEFSVEEIIEESKDHDSAGWSNIDQFSLTLAMFMAKFK